MKTALPSRQPKELTKSAKIVSVISPPKIPTMVAIPINVEKNL
ncbi:hypothetical protein QIW31_06475 [Francisellaceae bacterium CB299]